MGYPVRKAKNIWGFVPFWEPNPKYIWGFVPMPRPQRPDLHPTIWIPDTSEQQRRAEEVVGPNFGATVYPRGRISPYVQMHDNFYEWIEFLRSEGETIDHEVLNYMIGHLNFADARRIGEIDERGLVPYRMQLPGCRVNLRQKEIAVGMNCSEERVRTAIKRMRRCEIIVNQGQGWYEFDAILFWKGKPTLRLAYIQVQQDQMRIEFV